MLTVQRGWKTVNNSNRCRHLAFPSLSPLKRRRSELPGHKKQTFSASLLSLLAVRHVTLCDFGLLASETTFVSGGVNHQTRSQRKRKIEKLEENCWRRRHIFSFLCANKPMRFVLYSEATHKPRSCFFPAVFLLFSPPAAVLPAGRPGSSSWIWRMCRLSSPLCVLASSLLFISSSSTL